MNDNALVNTNGGGAEIIESVVIGGDLSKLSAEQRVSYYRGVCGSLGLNPLTKPFDYITLNGKLTLYAKKDCTDQLRSSRKVSIIKLERERIESIYTVTAYAQTPDGRQDSSIGAVNIENLKGDALANAIMKAETKAKRRVTLSICGLGMLDETETETIPDARPVIVQETGEIISNGATTGKAPMTLAEAEAIKNSDGVAYGEIQTETLVHMANTLGKIARRTREQESKLLACGIILKARNGSA